MIRDWSAWTEWERRWIAEQPTDFESNLRMLNAMYSWARQLGAFPPADPMEGIEVDIRIARALNVRSTH